MKRLSILALIFFLIILYNASGAFGETAPVELWKSFELAREKDLKKDMCVILDDIRAAAYKNKKYDEYLKALFLKLLIEDGKGRSKIRALESEIEKADGAVRAVMLVVLAGWCDNAILTDMYGNTIGTARGSDSDEDETAWSVESKYKKISKIYQDALSYENILLSVKAADFEGLLEKGFRNGELTPTLYDFAANKAADFYSKAIVKKLHRPDKFDVEANACIFEKADKFMAGRLECADSESPKYLLMKIYRKLLSIRKGDKNKNAFVNYDIGRILSVRNFVDSGEGGKFYIDRLNEIIGEFPAAESSAIAYYILAEELRRSKKNDEALALSEKCIEKFPVSEGAYECERLVFEIAPKSFALVGDYRMAPGRKNHVRIACSNIGKIYFRAVKDDWKAYSDFGFNDKGLPLNNHQVAEGFLALKADYEWSARIEKSGGRESREAKIEFPPMERGFYRVIASLKKDFSTGENELRYCSLWITDIAAVVKNVRDENICGIVLNSSTGEPLESAEITYNARNNYRNFDFDPYSARSDRDGFFTIDVSREYSGNGGELIVKHVEDMLIAEIRSSHSSIGPKYRKYSKVFMFTDRAVYRPGQKVMFKGLFVDIDQAGNIYRPIAGCETPVALKDAAGKTLSRLDCTSNGFGSFSGSFDLPPDASAGEASIEAGAKGAGECRILIEEYKRSRIAVEISAPRDNCVIGEDITVECRIVSNTGAAEPGAKLKYRVVQMPFWREHYSGYDYEKFETKESAGLYEDGREEDLWKEILNSEAVADENGKVLIAFKAAALKFSRAPEIKRGMYSFIVFASATGKSGDTASARRSLMAASSRFEAVLKIGDWQTTDKTVEVEISTLNFNGSAVETSGTVEVFEIAQPDSVFPVEPAAKERYFFDEASFKGIEKFEAQLAAGGIPAAGERGTAAAGDIGRWPNKKLAASAVYTSGAGGAAKIGFILPAGLYRAVLASKDKNGAAAKTDAIFAVCDTAAKNFDIKMPAFFVYESLKVNAGGVFRAVWGSGYEGARVFVEVIADGRHLKKYWSPAGAAQHLIEVPVTEEFRGKGFCVMTTFVRDNRVYANIARVSVPWSGGPLEIKINDFRSKLNPGGREKISISVRGADGKPKKVELAASLYDESLDAYQKLEWPDLGGIFYSNDTAVVFNFSNSFYLYGVLSRIKPSDLKREQKVFNEYYDLPHEIDNGSFGSRIVSASRPGDSQYEFFDGPEPLEENQPFLDGEPSLQKYRRMSYKGVIEFMNRYKYGFRYACIDEQNNPPVKNNLDLSKVKARKNPSESGFFFADAVTGEDGTAVLEFAMPETLARWRFIVFAHDAALENGCMEEFFVSSRELMVRPCPPRFIMEGDVLEFPVKLENMSGKDITGSVSLAFEESSTGAPIDAAFENSNQAKNFELKAGRSETLYWKIKAPRVAAPVKYTVRAAAGSYDDGEEGLLPVISSRVRVRESYPFTLNGPGEKKTPVDRIKYMASAPEIQDSCELTMRVVSNPSWYAFLAFPYLMDFPHECCEQVFNRLYAAAMASFLLEKNPGIKGDLEILNKTHGALYPGRTSTIGALAGYFDRNSLGLRVKTAHSKLRAAALPDNTWPWFSGGRANIDITLYIISGFGRLKKMGAADIDYEPASLALAAADSWAENTPYSGSNAAQSGEISLKQAAYYLYARSFYLKNMPLMGGPSGRTKLFIDSLKKSWENIESRLTLAHLATAFSRYGETETARKIMLHLKETSSRGADGEMFWAARAGLYCGGLDGDIEAQAAAVEGFLEAAGDPESAGRCAAWLINLKRAIHWPTTVATADAIYAISLCGENMFKSSCTAEIFIGGEMVVPDTVEAGSGYFEKSFSGRGVKPAFSEILFRTREKGVSWASAHLDYFDDVSRVTGGKSAPLKIKRTIRSGRDGSILQADSVINIGDELDVALEIDSDRDLDYVHIYDPRGCGFEPVDNLSKFVNGYHFSPRDQGARFYIERLAKGRSVIEHKLKACYGGKFNFAPASAECMYAPEFLAHSGSTVLEVK